MGGEGNRRERMGEDGFTGWEAQNGRYKWSKMSLNHLTYNPII